jgi:hypothetical protein
LRRRAPVHARGQLESDEAHRTAPVRNLECGTIQKFWLIAASPLPIKSRLCSITARKCTVCRGLILIGAVLVVVVGIAIYFLIRRQKASEPPHFGK